MDFFLTHPSTMLTWMQYWMQYWMPAKSFSRPSHPSPYADVIYGWSLRRSATYSPSKCLAWVKKCCHVWLDQNFDPSLLNYFDLFSWEWSKNIFFFFFEKKIQNGRLKKSSFFKIANSQNFFAKGIDVTYMAVRLSDKCSKTAKKYWKCIFWLFLSFWRTVSQPYTLSYIDALRIIQSY